VNIPFLLEDHIWTGHHFYYPIITIGFNRTSLENNMVYNILIPASKWRFPLKEIIVIASEVIQKGCWLIAHTGYRLRPRVNADAQERVEV
jgi:hypothetical protein